MQELTAKIILFACIILVNIAIVVFYRRVCIKKRMKPLVRLQEMFDKGLYREALTEAENLNDANLKPLLYEFIGNCHFELDNRDEAMQAYEKALSFDADLEFSYIGLGKLLLKDFKADDAIENLRKALQIDSKNTVAKYYLALAYEQKGNYDSAIRELVGAKEINPTVLAIYEKLEDLYLYLGKQSEANEIKKSMQYLKERSNY
jgi:tetratricopeptide (TPR) repeat protein